MSSGKACRNKSHREHWRVLQRKFNTSAFNGYQKTPSDYSLIECTQKGCHGMWRTKAAFVDSLPDVS